MVSVNNPTDGLGLLPALFLRKYLGRVAPMATELTSFRIIGGALMSFLDKGNKSGILAGIYLVNAVVAPLTIFYSVSKFELCVFDHWTNF